MNGQRQVSEHTLRTTLEVAAELRKEPRGHYLNATAAERPDAHTDPAQAIPGPGFGSRRETIATSPFAAASSEKLRWPWPPKISFLLLGLNFQILDGARWIDVDADQYAGGIWPEKLFFFRDVHRDLVLSFRAPISRRPIMCKSSKVGGQL